MILRANLYRLGPGGCDGGTDAVSSTSTLDPLKQYLSGEEGKGRQTSQETLRRLSNQGGND